MSYLEQLTGNPDHLLHEDRARYDWWLKLILGGTLALTLVLGLAFLATDITGTWILLAVTAFDALLFHAILPRRYQIFTDRLRIVLGYPFAWTIPFSTIEEARSVSGSKAFFYGGVRFTTSSETVVEIVRSQGWNLVISPAQRDTFLEYLTQALDETRN
jgi:hypothetical protein